MWQRSSGRYRISTWNKKEPHRKAAVGLYLYLQWAHLDSNQGPTDYESAALTD